MTLIPIAADDHVLGPATARASLVVYGDYQCPYTRAAHLAIRAVRDRMGMADEVRYVYRHFPLREIHPHAEDAAEVAEAASALGGADAFWRVTDHFFRHQDELDDYHLIAFAAEEGLDPVDVAEAIRQQTYAARVERYVESGRQAGVRGTPTIFLNGRHYGGERDAASLAAAVRGADAPLLH